MQEERALNVDGLHLNGDEWDRPIEQLNHVEEARSDILGDDDGAVLVLREAPALDVPIFKGTNQVTLVECTKHEFDFVPPPRFRVPQ